MEKIAFFDFDNTVYDGYTWGDFITYMSENVLKENLYPSKMEEVLKNNTDYNIIVDKLANILLEIVKDQSSMDIGVYSEKACNQAILDWVAPVLTFLKQNGFKTILVTASFPEFLSYSLEFVQFDEVLCSKFEIIDEKYTGKISYLLNSEEKVNAIKHKIESGNTFTVGFGDSMGDVPMLNAVNLPILVRENNSEIKEFAYQHGWLTSSDPEQIIRSIQNHPLFN